MNSNDIVSVWAPALWLYHADGSVTFRHAELRDTPQWVLDSNFCTVRLVAYGKQNCDVAMPQSGARPVAHRKQSCYVCCGSGTVMTTLDRVEPCPAVGCPFRQALVYQECVDGKWVDISKQRYDYLSSDRRCLRVVEP